MSTHSKDDRMRMQHMRIENEKKYLRQKKAFETDMVDKVSNLSKQEQLIRKQRLRLESEKTYNKSHSNLTKDRKLSLYAKESSDSSQSPQPGPASSPQPPEVKSKLFDYQKSSPRSRRQLLESGRTTPPSRARTPSLPSSPSPRILATHAIEGNKASHSDIVHHLTLNSDKPSKRDLRREARTINKTEPGSQSSSHNLPQLEHSEVECQASRRTPLQPEHKVTFNNEDKPQTPKLVKVKSTTEHCVKQKTNYHRRQSEPVPNIYVTDVHHDEASRDDENDAVKLRHLYNKAIETVKQVDESLMRRPHEKHKHNMDKRLPDHKSKPGLDINALRELEHILYDARVYSSRRNAKDDHHRLDLGSNRAQKKRIEHLEQVLKQLNPTYGDTSNDIDPLQVLQCGYLRLSKSNIATLEEMTRNQGRDPGIHIHSDVRNYNIWENIENERRDVGNKTSRL